MTLVVSRDTAGNVAIDYSSGDARISLAVGASEVSFTDAYEAPDAPAPEVVQPAAVETAEPPASPGPSGASTASALSVVPEDAAAADGAEHLAFKCPACGAEFDEQVECVNQHPAEPTLPTGDVLDGAAPQDPTAAEAASATSQPSQEEPPPAPEPSGSADGSEASSTSADSPTFPGQ